MMHDLHRFISSAVYIVRFVLLQIDCIQLAVAMHLFLLSTRIKAGSHTAG